MVVSRIVSKNINLPILNNVLIRATKSGIELAATNLEIGITHQLRGKIEDAGDYTVEAKIFTDYINLLPEEKVEAELKEDELNISCQNYQTKFKGQPATEFPLLPTLSRDKALKLNLEDFKNALAKVIFAAAAGENRAELSGVCMVFNQQSLVIAATDSYRLAEKKIVRKDNAADDIKIIVPARTLQELLRILSAYRPDEELEDGTEVKIYLSENQILFAFGATELVSRLIIGQYPDYRQIVPVNAKTKARANKAELIRAVKASALFSKNSINDVTLNFMKDESVLMLSSVSSQVGESVIKLKVQIEGADNETTVNYRYLLDGLNNIEGDEVVFELNNNTTPCLIKPKTEAESDYFYIIMPIRQ
jgi:DNA polymerase-3 subunit beta